MKDDSRRSPRTCIHALLFACLLVSPWATAQQVYRITDIGTFNGAEEMGGARINESGQGSGTAIVNGKERACLWDGNTLTNLGTLRGTQSAAHAPQKLDKENRL